MEKKFNYVYISTNLINGKQYIGDHSCDSLINDNYLGSGTYFLRSLNFHGKENFKKEILEFFNNKEDAFTAQQKYINEYNTCLPNGYNISPTGGLHVQGCHSIETIEKIKAAQRGRISKNKNKSYLEQYLEKYDIETAKNKAIQHKINLSYSKTGHEVTIETKTKISNTKEGVPNTPEHNKKISDSLSGIKKPIRSEEHTLKIIESRKKNGFIPWNKGLSKDTDERVKQGSIASGNSRIGKPSNMSGKTHKPESIEKIKNSKKKNESKN